MHNDLNVHTFAMDILELLDILKIDTISVCGISLGGVIAQELYTLQPKRIRSLILCHTMSYTPYLFRKLSISMGLKLFQNKTQEEIIESFVAQCLFNKKDEQIKAASKKAFYITKETFRESSVSSLSKNYLPLLPFFNIPVLIISSLQDHIVPSLCSIQTHTMLPNSTLRLIKNAGHLSNIEQKNEFNSIVKDFLKLKKRRCTSYSRSVV